MGGVDRDCCTSGDCCGSSPNGKEPPAATDGEPPPLLETSNPHQECAGTCTCESITTASSQTAADSASQQASLHSCKACDSPSSESSVISDDRKPPKTSPARVILTCCHPPEETSCCEPDMAPRLHPMPHHHGSHHHGSGAAQSTETCAHTRSTQSSSTCCSGSHVHEGTWLRRPDTPPVSLHDDGERGPTTLERVTLTVRGLKCGCCESGLASALGRTPAIRDYQVNIVLAKIEFNLDTSQLSVPEVIVRLHRDTGYTFEQFEQSEGQTLELLVSDPAGIYRAGRPYGVTLLDSKNKQLWSPSLLWSGRSSVIPPEVRSGSRTGQDPEPTEERRNPTSLFMHTVRVHYDAKLIGARDVFDYYQQLAPSQKMQLASSGVDRSTAVGAQQARRAFFMFIVALVFTIPILVFAWAPFSQKRMVYAHTSLALATVVQIIATREFVPSALQSLIHSGLFEMDFLIAMSTTTAYIFSFISYIFLIKKHPLETGSFFETSTLLVTLILLGRFVNEFARFRAAKSVSIRSIQTHDALLVISGGLPGPGATTRKIDARLLQYGDVFKVLPHTRIVTDGKVVYGGSEVDESMITGETLPVAKGLGHEVHAGTLNGSGQLVVELTKLPYENSISRIAAMVENAEFSKPKVQALADNIAGWFVPAIATIGFLVFVIWLFVDRYVNHRSWQNAVVKAFTYAIATLIVSCPCAIGLAVPMVVLIAGGTSARFGIIFRDPQKLEVARNATDIVFDKTGTLTKGALAVVEGQFHASQPRQVKGMIMGLLEGDKHPVAAAVMSWLEDDRRQDEEALIVPLKMVDIVSEPGNGVRGICEESELEVRAGNPQWLGVSVLESQHTLLCVTVGGVLSATFRLQDRPRQRADKLIRLLKQRNLQVHMISGDSEGAVDQMAHTLDIPKTQTRWRLKPEDKQRYIHDLQKGGKVVLFCGDGTNDSVALKQADVGVHMNQGTDAAKSASDVVLMASRPHDILVLLDISKAAYRRIITNFAWSATYNVVAILMASGAFVRVRIAPAYAGLGELVSVLPVVLIAFQMSWRDYGRKYRSLEYQ